MNSITRAIKREWQDNDYVLGYFGKRKSQARKEYESYVKKGVTQGRRNELTGGGLIRSLGGWSEATEGIIQIITKGIKPKTISSGKL